MAHLKKTPATETKKLGAKAKQEMARMNAISATSQEVEDSARKSPLGKASPRGAIMRATNWAMSLGGSPRARATRHGIKASKIIRERNKKKKKK